MGSKQNSFSYRNEKITYTLFSIASAVNTTNNLDDLYLSIYDSLNELIELPNFFMAIVDKEKKLLSFPFFVDENDTEETITRGLEQYETSTSNTSQVILKKKPLFLKKEVLKEKYRQKRTIGTVSVVWVGIPLIVRDEVIGVMVVQHYTDPNYFSQNEIDLLIAVSDQIALAIDRKKAQEKIKLNEQITQTLFSIASAVNISSNLDDLYKSIYDSLNRVIFFPNFFICLLSKDKKKMHFPFYLDEYDSEETISFTVEYDESNNYISTEVINKKETILLTKEMIDKRVAQGTILGKNPQIWLGVPLIIRDEVIGVMATQHYHDPKYFSQKAVELFIAVSGQVAIAIDRQQYQIELKREKAKTEQTNIDLQNQINERKHSENINKTLFAISNAVNVTLNLKDLYKQIHKLLGDIIDVTNFFIAVVDNKEKTLNYPYYVDTQDDDFYPIVDFKPEGSLSGMVVAERKGLFLKEKQLKEIKVQKGILGPTPVNWMGVPLIVKDEVIGLIAVQSYTNAQLYNDQDLKVLSSVSDQVAIAIDRKRAEEEVRLSEKRYRHLFDNAPVAMYEIDFINGKFISLNKVLCSSLGYTEEEILSMEPLSFFTMKSKKKFLEGYADLLKGKQVTDNVEYDVFKKDGQKMCVVLHYDFIYEKSKVHGAQVVVHDITERKKIENIMIQSEKMMSVGGLAAGMAHEINNPLAGIMQNVQLVINRLSKSLPANDKEAHKAGITIAAIRNYMEKRKILKLLDNIHHAGSRAATIVDNMLSFARKGNASKFNCSIPELIEKTIKLAQSDYDLKKKYDFKQIKIVNYFDPSTPEVACEESKILQVLFNIIKNAGESMYGEKQKEEGPQIIFRVLKKGKMVQVEIEDNGPGMDEKIRNRIFEPFFTTKAKDRDFWLVLIGHGLKIIVKIDFRIVAGSGQIHGIYKTAKGVSPVFANPYHLNGAIAFAYSAASLPNFKMTAGFLGSPLRSRSPGQFSSSYFVTIPKTGQTLFYGVFSDQETGSLIINLVPFPTADSTSNSPL